MTAICKKHQRNALKMWTFHTEGLRNVTLSRDSKAKIENENCAVKP